MKKIAFIFLLGVMGVLSFLAGTRCNLLDPGLERKVSADQGQGFFEPRQVEGAITHSIAPVPGNAVCQVCGMTIREDQAKAFGRIVDYQGKTYHFCSEACKLHFAGNADRYCLAEQKKSGMTTQHSSPRQEDGVEGTGIGNGSLNHSPTCSGLTVDQGLTMKEIVYIVSMQDTLQVLSDVIQVQEKLMNSQSFNEGDLRQQLAQLKEKTNRLKADYKEMLTDQATGGD